MFKVIVKTAIKVILLLAVLAAVAFGVLSFGFPKVMADYFEKRENYSVAAGYASLAYTYSGEAADVARCVQDNVLAGNDKNTEIFGDKLLSNSGFNALCECETERLGLDYRQYICGKISLAKYRNGNKEGAIQTATEAITASGGFSRNNALVQLAVEVSSANDKETAQSLKSFLEECAFEGEYCAQTIAALDKIING